MSTKTDLSKTGKGNKLVVNRATIGRKTIRNRHNLNAVIFFVYFLPYRKTPSMKMATVEVVLPNMCNETDIGEGMDIGLKESKRPDVIDRTSGFLVSLVKTFCNPVHSVDVSTVYNSRTVIVIITDSGEIKADAIVANPSPLIGKANVI
jgi:hypothetical protein